MTDTLTPPEPRCGGCDRTPASIAEYVSAAAVMNVTPDEYVRLEEGTYNDENGHFLCDGCYINAGMPSGPGRGQRWVCP